MSELDSVQEAPLTTPLDGQSLLLLREATLVHVTGLSDDDSFVYSGEFTLDQLLDFWSGIDETCYRPLGLQPDPITGEHDVEWFECTRPVLTPTDVIRDLIDEILRLRTESLAA